MKYKEKSKGFASIKTINKWFGLKPNASYQYKSRADKYLKIK